MTTSLVKGWCPSLLNPMESGDGFLARVKPRAAMLSAGAARAIAAAAATHGNGLMDVTNRSNLQFRGFAEDAVAAFAEAVIGVGLARREVPLEQLRNVAASPLGGVDPSAAFDAAEAAVEIEEMLLASPDLLALPPKFGFSVDGGGALPLGDVGADILFYADGFDAYVGLGGTGLRARYRPGEIAAVAHDLARAFLDLAKGRPGPPRRMRQLVGAVGAAAVFAKAGLSPSKSEGRPAGVSDAFIGFRPYTDEGRGFFSFGLAFGQCDGEAVTRLADLAERFGDGFLRTTPWRALVIAEVEPDAANKLARKGEKAGFITSIEDPRRTIVACPGKPACLSATVKTREDAAKLARSGIAGGRMVHVSGCAKGCSHPRAAPVTIAGRDGRYDLILDGRAGDVARRQGLDIGGVIAALHDIFGGVPA